MEKTRTQKAALNTLMAALLEAEQLISGLILPRLIIANFGSAYNGITSSATQFLNAVSILTVGVAGATRVALYRALAEKDNKKISGIIRATELYMQKVGIVLLVFMAVLTAVYPFVVETGYSWIEVAPLIVAAGIGMFGRFFFGTTYNALLAADQSFYISNVFSIITGILNVIATVLLINLGFGIQIVKFGSALFLLANPILRACYVRKKYKLDRKCEPDNSALSARKDVMAHSIANIVHGNTSMVLLTIFCNVKIVSVYTAYDLVMNALRKTQQVFTEGTEAVFGNMWTKGEFDKIKKNLGYYEHIVASFASIVFSTTLVAILPFISLYTKGVTDVEYVLPAYAMVITVAQVFYCFRAPYLTLVQGAGHYKQTKTAAYMEAGINLAVSIILVQIIGIVGVAAGTLIANLFRTVQYALYIDKHIAPRGKTVFVKRIIWASANILIVFLLTYDLVSRYAYAGWLQWVICAAAVTMLSAAVTVVSSLLCYREDLQGVIQILKRSVGRRSKRK